MRSPWQSFGVNSHLFKKFRDFATPENHKCRFDFVSQPRIDGFAFHGQDAEDAFMDSPEWLFAGESFQSLNSQGEFTEGQ
jgi:hypothetical protein